MFFSSLVQRPAVARRGHAATGTLRPSVLVGSVTAGPTCKSMKASRGFLPAAPSGRSSVAWHRRAPSRGSRCAAQASELGSQCGDVTNKLFGGNGATDNDDEDGSDNDCVGDYSDDDEGEFPLHSAIRLGDTEAMRRALELGADLEEENEDGWTPLYLAADRGNGEAVELLLGLGADADAMVDDPVCPAPLHAAAKSGALWAMKVLLEGGAEVDVRNMYGQTPLHLVDNHAAKEAVQLLLKHGAEVDARDEYDTTPLHCASGWWGSEEAVQVLLEHGAEVDARDKEGWTPLCKASHAGRYKAAQLLLHNGADANAKAQFGCMPLHLAAGAHWPMGDMEGYEGDRMVATVQLLISTGAVDVNARCSDGKTPLHHASFVGWVEVVQLLLDKGAEVDARNQAGRTPLHKAAHGYDEGSAGVLRLLAAAGADVDAVDNYGDTPVALAAVEGKLEAVQALHAAGADMVDPKLHRVPLADQVEAVLREREAWAAQAWKTEKEREEEVASLKQVLHYLHQQRAP